MKWYIYMLCGFTMWALITVHGQVKDGKIEARIYAVAEQAMARGYSKGYQNSDIDHAMNTVKKHKWGSASQWAELGL